ncbi:zinc-binding protein A33-like [Chiloscyllium plagiosum]|uniref:zinc-binding protein A33-like n=1 Tax=Chiloscyllium plagiosum TaxID=36176 RepID=UPI001CB844F1|nr:zinc-binding protein A33-like [Chiloscyllium plagiosum]
MEEVFRSQNEEETNMIQLKKMAESLEQNIAAEFTTLHQFLNDEEELMKGKLKDDVERLTRLLRENLQRITEKRASIECTILEIQQRLNVQETAFLADVKSLIERSYVKFKKPAEVPLNLLLGEFGGPLQLIVWRRMLSVISPDSCPPPDGLLSDLCTILKFDYNAIGSFIQAININCKQLRFQNQPLWLSDVAVCQLENDPEIPIRKTMLPIIPSTGPRVVISCSLLCDAMGTPTAQVQFP